MKKSEIRIMPYKTNSVVVRGFVRVAARLQPA